MKYFCTIFFLSLLPLLSFGQSEYFLTDSTSSFGIKLIDGGDRVNSEFCQVKQGSKTLYYTPDEVKEYGFKDGRVFISKEIQTTRSTKRVFLERILSGNTTLYYLNGYEGKAFFIQKDSSLFVEIRKQVDEEDYSIQLLNLTKDCSNVSDACKLVRYNKRSFSRLISMYNQCELKPFPFFKFGFIFGYEFLQLIPLSEQFGNLEYFDFDYDGSFSIGVFLDNPIQVSDFSLHADLLLSKHAYSYNKIVENKDLDFVANLTSLHFPLLLRYAYPSNKIRPFINAGIRGTYLINNKTSIYESLINETTIEIGDTDTNSVISNFQFGYVFGGGLEYKLNYRNSLFFELRFCNQYKLGDSQFLGSSEYSVLSGINF